MSATDPTDEATRETCPACASTSLRRRVYGLPTPQTIEQVEHDPDLELGGCMISPTFWATKCKDCGHEITLGETMSIFRHGSGDEGDLRG